MKTHTYLYLIIYSYLHFHSYGYESNQTALEDGILYLRNIDEVKILCGTRTIEYQVNLDKIFKLRENIIATLELMTHICSQAKSNVLCDLTINEIKLKLISVENKLRIIDLTNPIPRIYSKQKREIKIEDLKEYVIKTISIADDGYSDMKQYLEELKSLVNALGRSQNNLNNYIDYINFNLLAQNVVINIDKQNFIYNILLDILTKSSVKSIMELIDNRYLKEEIQKIQRTIEKDTCEFPEIKKIFDIIQVLEISKRYTKINNNNLIIQIEFPIEYKYRYKLVEAISIPFINKNSAYKAIPTDPYVLVYQDKRTGDVYRIPLSMREKNACQPIKDYYLCTPERILQTTKISQDIQWGEFFLPNYEYIVKLFKEEIIINGTNYIPNIQRIPFASQIIEVNKDAYYLFLVNNTTVKMICETEHDEYTFNKPILIKNLRDKCDIQMTQLYYPRTQNMFLKEVQINVKNMHITIPTNETLIPGQILPKINTNSLRNLQYEFGKLHEQINRENEKIQNNSSTQNNKKNHIKSEISDKQVLAGIIVIILFLVTWFIAAKTLYKLTGRIDQISNKISKQEPNVPTWRPELNCKFKFDEPAMPQKRSEYSKASKRVRFTNSTYDVPKMYAITTNIEETHTSEQFENQEIINLPELDTLNKQFLTDSPSPILKPINHETRVIIH